MTRVNPGSGRGWGTLAVTTRVRAGSQASCRAAAAETAPRRSSWAGGAPSRRSSVAAWTTTVTWGRTPPTMGARPPSSARRARVTSASARRCSGVRWSSAAGGGGVGGDGGEQGLPGERVEAELPDHRSRRVLVIMRRRWRWARSSRSARAVGVDFMEVGVNDAAQPVGVKLWRLVGDEPVEPSQRLGGHRSRTAAAAVAACAAVMVPSANAAAVSGSSARWRASRDCRSATPGARRQRSVSQSFCERAPSIFHASSRSWAAVSLARRAARRSTCTATSTSSSPSSAGSRVSGSTAVSVSTADRSSPISSPLSGSIEHVFGV